MKRKRQVPEELNFFKGLFFGVLYLTLLILVLGGGIYAGVSFFS